MTKKAQTIFTVCFVAFLISVVSLSFVFADSIPHNTETPQITGGYLFSFDVRCVDEEGNLLKNVSFLENGTAWAVDAPEIDGFTPGCTSITRDMVKNWNYPPSHYARKATGSITIQYKANV